ncbi:hypothetical protein EPA93_20855 [Ktedonosporobacter rubrisoli]|uniref:Uncharacterized protein n=1 Tax=Ktedonosporobacter rubrisoli TaxID=2509675 RepID=A0A4P6K6B0_KTERU|nr:hypothetical protein EPA93_20855 [Ktedonosporobacter rubrisoli]
MVLRLLASLSSF